MQDIQPANGSADNDDTVVVTSEEPTTTKAGDNVMVGSHPSHSSHPSSPATETPTTVSETPTDDVNLMNQPPSPPLLQATAAGTAATPDTPTTSAAESELAPLNVDMLRNGNGNGNNGIHSSRPAMMMAASSSSSIHSGSVSALTFNTRKSTVNSTKHSSSDGNHGNGNNGASSSDKPRPPKKKQHNHLTEDSVRAFLVDYFEDWNTLGSGVECWKSFLETRHVAHYRLIRGNGTISTLTNVLEENIGAGTSNATISNSGGNSKTTTIKPMKRFLRTIDSITMVAAHRAAIVTYTIDYVNDDDEGSGNNTLRVVTTGFLEENTRSQPQFVHEHQSIGYNPNQQDNNVDHSQQQQRTSLSTSTSVSTSKPSSAAPPPPPPEQPVYRSPKMGGPIKQKPVRKSLSPRPHRSPKNHDTNNSSMLSSSLHRSPRTTSTTIPRTLLEEDVLDFELPLEQSKRRRHGSKDFDLLSSSDDTDDSELMIQLNDLNTSNHSKSTMLRRGHGSMTSINSCGSRFDQVLERVESDCQMKLPQRLQHVQSDTKLLSAWQSPQSNGARRNADWDAKAKPPAINTIVSNPTLLNAFRSSPALAVSAISNQSKTKNAHFASVFGTNRKAFDGGKPASAMSSRTKQALLQDFMVPKRGSASRFDQVLLQPKQEDGLVPPDRTSSAGKHSTAKNSQSTTTTAPTNEDATASAIANSMLQNAKKSADFLMPLKSVESKATQSNASKPATKNKSSSSSDMHPSKPQRKASMEV